MLLGPLGHCSSCQVGVGAGESADPIAAMSVKDLRALVESAGLSIVGQTETHEIAARAREAKKIINARAATEASKPKPKSAAVPTAANKSDSADDFRSRIDEALLAKSKASLAVRAASRGQCVVCVACVAACCGLTLPLSLSHTHLDSF